MPKSPPQPRDSDVIILGQVLHNEVFKCSVDDLNMQLGLKTPVLGDGLQLGQSKALPLLEPRIVECVHVCVYARARAHPRVCAGRGNKEVKQEKYHLATVHARECKLKGRWPGGSASVWGRVPGLGGRLGVQRPWSWARVPRELFAFPQPKSTWV